MSESDGKTNQRRYPGFYERAVPIALVAIVVCILVLLAVVLGVALDLFPGM